MQEYITLPGEPLPSNSPLYIERPPIETEAYRELRKPGSLIRIKAASRMGKNSLMIRLIEKIKEHQYSVVSIDCKQADNKLFTDLSRFLRWFCVNVARQLSLIPNLDDYWDEDIGSKVSASIYFEGYILNQIDQPLVLILNEVNYIFEHSQIAPDFLSLLRSWYEQAKQNPIWQKLRLVIIHSTEIYIPLNINQSPFNVGLVLKLPEFTPSQVLELAHRYNLKWFNDDDVQKLMQLVGGHPYLIQLAFYHLYQQKISFAKLIKTATLDHSIYIDHLRYLATQLQQNVQLSQVYYQIINSEDNHLLPQNIIHQLDSLGIIKYHAGNYRPACEIYSLFFQKEHLALETNEYLRLQRLEIENKRLKLLVNIDQLTQIANRRYFDICFESEWKRMIRSKKPLALILIDIDGFKIFNDTYGHQAGDICLYQVAQTIYSVIKRPADTVARYGGEEFGVILPETDIHGAKIIAEEIRIKVAELKITLDNVHGKNQEPLTTQVTISLGIGCMIPELSSNMKELFSSTDQALYDAKKNGRNRVICNSK